MCRLGWSDLDIRLYDRRVFAFALETGIVNITVLLIGGGLVQRLWNEVVM
jgi:hypothetical protein